MYTTLDRLYAVFFYIIVSMVDKASKDLFGIIITHCRCLHRILPPQTEFHHDAGGRPTNLWE